MLVLLLRPLPKPDEKIKETYNCTTEDYCPRRRSAIDTVANDLLEQMNNGDSVPDSIVR